ncbi:MAG: hypothetical protein KGL39_54240 [Patescibacteria group bacterium]|nr:hypothetical protein [Patescibacteria group bacterium]
MNTRDFVVFVYAILRNYTYDELMTTPAKLGNRLNHVAWMVQELFTWDLNADRDKTMRWVGFIQGALFGLNMFTIRDLRLHVIHAKECPDAKRYRGKRVPRCNHGAGCVECWRKYNAVHEISLHQ